MSTSKLLSESNPYMKKKKGKKDKVEDQQPVLPTGIKGSKLVANLSTHSLSAGEKGKEKASEKKTLPSASDRDLLRQEVLALGGDEEELEMLLGVESDSEIEGDSVTHTAALTSKSKTKKGKKIETVDADPQLSKELRTLVKSLDFSAFTSASTAADSAEEHEQEDGEGGSEDSSDEDEDEDEENSDNSEGDEVLKDTSIKKDLLPASTAPKEIAQESKAQREQRRKVEREAEKEAEKLVKDASKEKKEASRLTQVKTPWVVDPTAQWYNVALPALNVMPRPTPATISTLHAQGKALLDKENSLFTSSLTPSFSKSAPPPPNGLSKADQVFIQQILTSGTSSDKISALLLLVSSSPLHTTTYLEQILGLCKKKSREESGRAMRGVIEWWRGNGGEGGGAPSRKLKTFADQPGLGALAAASSALEKGIETVGVSAEDVQRCLVVWTFEDWFKKWFFEVLKALEQMSLDPIPHPRGLAVLHLSNLLRDKPEQEGNILRLLVNKLGDSQKSIASKTSHHLLQILQYHPGMTSILVREVSALVLRPSTTSLPSVKGHVRFDADKKKEKPKIEKNTGQEHARYYGIITLNQVVLSKNQAEVAGKMIEVYFEIFGDLLGRISGDDELVNDDVENIQEEESRLQGSKRKRDIDHKHKNGKKAERPESIQEADSKLVAAVLTGINRAFPFAKIDDEAFEKRLDLLFRITHTGTFNVSIQALMLIYHVSSHKKVVTDRFYRALYASLFDPRLASSSKQALYLNLVFKAIKQDREVNRVMAFVKRLIQLMSSMDTIFILGSIWIIGELMSSVSGLRSLFTRPESGKKSTKDVESFKEVNETAEDQTYDGKKREPLFAHAERSCAWEIMPLLHHYHPTVALHAENLLAGEAISASTDLEQHSLNHFLDRFVYREAKKTAAVKGSSMMQSGLTGQDRTGRIVLTKGPARGEDSVVNTENFRQKSVGQVPVDQLFFHKYFTIKSANFGDKVNAKKKRKSRKGKDSDDEESIADLGFSDPDEEEEKGNLDGGDEEDENEEEEDVNEEEIWNAMKKSMPKAGDDGDSLEEDVDVDDLDEDLAEFDYSDSDEDENEDDIPYKSAFADEDDMGDDGDNDLVEDEDDLLGSDEDMPDYAISGDEEDAETKQTSKTDERKNKKRKVKHLPTFATADDYAHLLGADDDEE